MTNLKTFSQTGLDNNFSLNLANKKYMSYDASNAEVLFQSMASGICEILSIKKSKTTPVAVEIRDLKGNLMMAAIVSYESESDSEVGNWTLSFTFNEEDIPEGATIYSITDSDCKIIITEDSKRRYGMSYMSSTYIYDIFTEIVSTIKEYLDKNATADEELEVEVPGAFVISVAIEDGEKVMGITPSENMKQIVKNDKAV